MNIALTGGTGFIGSHFLDLALSSGHVVRAIRRSSQSKSRFQLNQSPSWINGQFDNISALELQNCDVFVHLATHSGNFPYDSLENCIKWNVTAVLALFEQARLSGIKRFVVAGSCFEYGASGERYDCIPSDAPLEPTNSYATSKAIASIALKQWAEDHKLSLEILRVFHVYGLGETESRLWPSLRHAALSGDNFSMTKGEQIRDFMAVEEVAATFLERAISSNYSPIGCEIYNLSSGKPMSMRHFAEYWWNHWNASGDLLVGKLPYRDGEVMRFVPGNKKILLSNKEAIS